MEVFIVLFIYLLGVKFLTPHQNRLIISIFSGLGLWLVLALRSPYCGIDLMSGPSGSANYYNMFVRASDCSIYEILQGDLSYYSSMEMGWLLYCKLLSFVSTSFQVFLAFTALLQICLVGFIFYKYSTDIVLSYIVYFCFGLYVFSFSGLRQSTALTITFLAFHFLLNQRYKYFVILVMLASTFHSTAILFLVVFLFNYIRFTFLKTNLSLVAIFLAMPLLRGLVATLTVVVFGTRYQHFQDAGGAITLFLLYVLITIFSLKMENKTKYDNYLRGMLLITVAAQSLGYISSGAMTRIGYYYSIFFALIFPMLISAYSNKKTRLYTSGIVSFLFLIYFVLVNRGGYLNVIPYYFFWEMPYTY